MKKFFIIILFLCLCCTSKTNSQDIFVAYTIDNNYPIFALLSINSILKNNNDNNQYFFYIIENNLSDKNKQKMSDYVNNRNQKIEFIHFDTDVIDNGKILYKHINRVTNIGLARIMLPELLPDNIQKVIYLDGDTLVTDNLSILYNIDLKNRAAGMVLNITPPEGLLKNKQRYYNSGVIVFNLDKWRKNKISNRMLDFINDNFELFYTKNKEKAYLYPDQDLLNIILKNDIYTIATEWNNQTTPSGTLLADSKGIYHYVGQNKPWDFPITNQEYYKTYYKYWNKSSLKKYKYYYFLKSIKHKLLSIFK